MEITDFHSLVDLLSTYTTEAKCSQYVADRRWHGKPVCPHCGKDEKVYAFTDDIYYKCGVCRKKFTVRIGTIFGDSKLPLQKWFAAIWLFTSHKKGISSVQLKKDLKITQKSAWFVLHRLRYAMEHPDYKKPLENTVEADETYIGGKEKNRHLSKRGGKQGQGFIGRNGDDKSAVFGVVERQGNVIAKHVTDVKKGTLQPIIIKNVKAFSRVITDEWYAYNGLDKVDFSHSTIKHAVKEYVIGDIHTNTIENFWSTLKRGIYGIYHHTSKKHLQRYIEEFCYRYNNRHLEENARFDLLLKQANTGELQYKDLIK